MDIIKKCRNFHKQLIEEKAQWEAIIEKSCDKASCANELNDINRQIEFLEKAFEVNNISLD